MKTTALKPVTKARLVAEIAAMKTPRSAWRKGVKIYAEELIEALEVDEIDPSKLDAEMLSGAQSWKASSEGGSHLIYDSQIAERLCSPSELKKYKGGERQPNSGESWLLVQARALGQAAKMIARLARPTNGRGTESIGTA